MNFILTIALGVAAFFQASAPITPTNWYVRPDGGTRYSNATDTPTGQCNGQADASVATALAAAKGATTNLPCAFGEMADLAFDGNYTLVPKWIIKGGDIVHIAVGSWRVGYRGPNATDHDGLSIAGNPYSEALPSVPSGTAANPTQFIGAGSTLTQIYAGYGAAAVFGLQGSQNVTIQGIEMTDHGQCTRLGVTTPQVPYCSNSYPIDDDAAGGIDTDQTTIAIVLRDLNIHGFTEQGILGPIGGLFTVDHVRIAFNGSSGWNFDNGGGVQNGSTAQVNASYLSVVGNGCNEEYPIVHTSFPANTCFDQGTAGYGDGVGTPNTPLNFACDHCSFAYNTQDGLDLLHVSGSVIKVTNSTSYGNEGQQWKFGAMTSVVFQNNTTVHNCNRMQHPMGGNSTYFKYLTLPCRAAGDGFAFSVMDGGTYVFQNNSFVGYGTTSYDIGCVETCTQANIVYQNNLNIGYADPIVGQGGALPGVFYMGDGVPANPFKLGSNNVYFNMRTVPEGGVGTDPHIANEPTAAQVAADETVLDNVDFHLTSASSNATGQGVGGVDIGAYGVASVVTLPPSGGSSTTGTTGTTGTTNPPPATTPSAFNITIKLTCTPNGTAYTCASK